jgi:hypothetical protein
LERNERSWSVIARRVAASIAKLPTPIHNGGAADCRQQAKLKLKETRQIPPPYTNGEAAQTKG